MTRRTKLSLACFALAAAFSGGEARADDEGYYQQCVVASWAAYFQCRDWHSEPECNTMKNSMLALCDAWLAQHPQ